MKTSIFLFHLVLHETAAVTHSLKYFYTGSSGIANFPEFVTVGMVDDFQIDHYDSNTGRAQIKQDWMNKVFADDPQYLERNSQTYTGNQRWFKLNIEIVRQRFNLSKGVHIAQYMYGCDWNDETQQVIKVYQQHGYDGEDWLVWDMETNTFIAPKQQAEMTKNKWNSIKADLEYRKKYLYQICPESLKKYINYGKSSLIRTGIITKTDYLKPCITRTENFFFELAAQQVTLSLQQEGPVFKFQPEFFLDRVSMFSLCMHGFLPGTPASTRCPKSQL